LRFVEVTINGPKTWSLAAALHPEISAALDAAQERAAEQIIGWIARHATTRVGPRWRQVQVPVEQIEAAVIRHYTSRAGDPHRHLHLQVNARVFAEGKWRGLHSVGVRDMIEAINGIGHAAVATDPEFRAALAAHGFTMDTAGELVELVPHVGRFSARANQIHRNIDRYEAEWRHEHPDEEPGPRLLEAWDRRAWAQGQPDKSSKLGPIDGAAMVAGWNRLLHDLGYGDPVQVGLPIPPGGPSVGSLDRDGIAALVVAELGAEHSAWNAADVRGRVEKHLAAAGLITDAAVRLDLAEDITARATALCVPLIEDPGVPEHVRSLTSQHVLDVEADLVAVMAQRSGHPGRPVDVGAAPVGLDEAQRDAVAVLAGTGQLVLVEGAAGAGKTTALAAVREQLAQQGQRMVVVTPTLKAAQAATKETGVHATSAAGLAREFSWQWDNAGHWQQQPKNATDSVAHQAATLAHGDLLLVDEAGMLDQDTALALFQIAEQTDARIALVGDRHQLPAVGRGGILDLAARWAHPDAVVGLDVVHRFADPDYAAISLAMRRGEHASEIFDRLWERGQIRLHATEPERLYAIATEAAQRITANGSEAGDVVVMADTLAQVSVLNGIIRDQLVTHGLVDDRRAVTTNAGERIGVGDRVATRLNDHHPASPTATSGR
jgi:nucleoside-triphosphatase THEP1